MHLDKDLSQQKIESIQMFSLEETNWIQTNLILESQLDPESWIQENSARFREIINLHPELVDLYHKNPKAFMEFIRKELEGQRTLH